MSNRNIIADTHFQTKSCSARSLVIQFFMSIELSRLHFDRFSCQAECILMKGLDRECTSKREKDELFLKYYLVEKYEEK